MEKLLCVCQKCGKDMGTVAKPKKMVYKEKDGTYYCAKCFEKKSK